MWHCFLAPYKYSYLLTYLLTLLIVSCARRCKICYLRFPWELRLNISSIVWIYSVPHHISGSGGFRNWWWENEPSPFITSCPPFPVFPYREVLPSPARTWVGGSAAGALAPQTLFVYFDFWVKKSLLVVTICETYFAIHNIFKKYLICICRFTLVHSAL